MGKPLLLAAALAVALPCAAQTITDGDTLKQGGIIYRLWGIDEMPNWDTDEKSKSKNEAKEWRLL